MSFLEDSQKDSYNPIYLVQFDVTDELEFTTTKYAFVYVVSFLNEYDWIPADFLINTEVDFVELVGSMRMGNSFLRSVDSITECVDNRETFYFNTSDKKLYLHPPNGDNPYIFLTQIGIIFGIRKGGGDRAYWNNIYYDDIVISVPSISRSKADYFNGRNINEGGELIFGNASGEYDTWAEDNTILGNAIRIYIGFEGYEFVDFVLTTIGYVKNISVGVSEVRVQIQDKKERLNNPIPERTFEISDYQYLNKNNIGFPIPLPYGKIRNMPVVCVNEDQYDYDADSRPGVPVTIYFVVADMTDYTTLHAITTIRADDGDGHLTDITAHCSIDLNAGTFTTTSDYYVPGQTIIIDIEGYEDSNGDLIENALDIIKELIINYTSANFNNVYFNISRWDKPRAWNIGIPINEVKGLIEWIEIITQGGTLANFQIDDDDRYSCRILNIASAVDLELHEWDIFNEIAVGYDQEKLVAELIVQYDKDWLSGEYSKYIDDTYKSVNNKSYQTYLKKPVDTLLSNNADAISFASEYLKIFGVPYRTFTVLTSLIAYRQEISNIILIDLKRPYAPKMGVAKCEIISHNKNYDEANITLGLRIFELTLPQTWSDGHDWYSFDWYGDDWAVGMFVDDLTA